MRNTNQVTLVGNIGRDPEMKYAQNGSAVCTFSMATTERWKQGDEWKEKTEWHNIVVYGKTAEAVGQVAEKGNKCIVIGKIQTRSYEVNGEKRYTTEIVANEFALLMTEPSSGKPRASASAPAAPDEDDCPF